MIVAALFFYLFATLCVAAGFMVISSRNPVHSVLWLILAFFNSAGLFLLLGAEFVAVIMVIVYVGAVAVLFLFVVMMLDIDVAKMRSGMLQYLPIGATIGIVLLIELLLVVTTWTISPDTVKAVAPIPTDVSNTEAIGRILYTQYVYYFQTAGMVLLVAMIGAIVLTLRHKPNVRRQNVADQVARSPETSIEIKKVKSGQGI